jgi:hypothetical protein
MPVAEWTCIGKRRTVDGKLGVWFVDADGKEHGIIPRAHSAFRHARPGQVFSVETTDDGKVKTDNARYLRLEQSERVEGWIVESAAEEVRQEAISRTKKTGEEQTIKTMLEPIREIYQKQITPAGRAAVLMSVMEAITR